MDATVLCYVMLWHSLYASHLQAADADAVRELQAALHKAELDEAELTAEGDELYRTLQAAQKETKEAQVCRRVITNGCRMTSNSARYSLDRAYTHRSRARSHTHTHTRGVRAQVQAQLHARAAAASTR